MSRPDFLDPDSPHIIPPERVLNPSQYLLPFFDFLDPVAIRVKEFVEVYFKETLLTTASLVPLFVLPKAFLGGVLLGAAGAFLVPHYASKVEELIDDKVISILSHRKIKRELSHMNQALMSTVSEIFDDKKATSLSTVIQCVIAASSFFFREAFLGFAAGVQLGAFGYTHLKPIVSDYVAKIYPASDKPEVLKELEDESPHEPIIESPEEPMTISTQDSGSVIDFDDLKE